MIRMKKITENKDVRTIWIRIESIQIRFDLNLCNTNTNYLKILKRFKYKSHIDNLVKSYFPL